MLYGLDFYKGGKHYKSRMLTIYCALFGEAQEIIKIFQLKKETKNTHFQVFSDVEQKIRLVITGVGAIAAATAVAEISTCYPPRQTDLLLNFGSCAAENGIPAGKIFVCNKLVEQCSGRTFYPDMLYQHPFAEARLISSPQMQTLDQIALDCGQEVDEQEKRLYDMEAAAIYQAGNYYYGPHQMVFIKAVLEHGCTKEVFEPVCRYIETLCAICCIKKAEQQDLEMLQQKAKEEAVLWGEQMHCSTVMQAELLQLLYYWKLTGTDYVMFFYDYQRQGRLPAKDKREGKKILDELKGRL